MAKTKDQKKNNIKQIAESIDNQKSMVFVDYQGLLACDMSELRKRLKQAECKLMVVKKTLLGIIFKEKKIDFDPKNLRGQTAIIFGLGDELSPAKISYNFGKEKESLKILGGFFENKIIDEKAVVSLAQIPSKQELLSKVAGSISSPVSSFVRVLQGNLRNLVFALSAIKK